MSEQLAKRFIEALKKLEAERELDQIVSLFAENCEVGNVVSPEKFHGLDGAREFWGAKYRDTFGEVRSTFGSVFATQTHAALEWSTEGTSANGAGVAYDGVSVLEIDGEKITRFRAYFDASNLGRQIMQKARGQN